MYNTKRELELAAGYAEERVQEQLRKDSDRLTKHRVRYPNIEQASAQVQATRRRYEQNKADSWIALEQTREHYDKLLAEWDNNNSDSDSDNSEGAAQAAPAAQADSSSSAPAQAIMTEAAIDAIYTQQPKADQALSNLLHSLESANKAEQRSAVEVNAIEYLREVQEQLRKHIASIVTAYVDTRNAAQAARLDEELRLREQKAQEQLAAALAAHKQAAADSSDNSDNSDNSDSDSDSEGAAQAAPSAQADNSDMAQAAANIIDTESKLEQAVQAGDSDTADDLRAKLQGQRLDMQDLQRAKRQEQLAIVQAAQAADDLQAQIDTAKADSAFAEYMMTSAEYLQQPKAAQIQRLQRSVKFWQQEARNAKSDKERALWQAYADMDTSNLALVDGSFTQEHVTQRAAIKAQVAAAKAALASEEQGARKRPAKSKQTAPAAPPKRKAKAKSSKRKAVKAKAADSATKAKRAARNAKRREQREAADKQRLAQQAMARYRKAAANADKDSLQARLAQQAMARLRKAAAGRS